MLKRKFLDDAASTSSRTCIARRESCKNFGRKVRPPVVGLSDERSRRLQPRTWSRTLAQAASTACCPNKSILCDKSVSISPRLVFLNAMGPPQHLQTGLPSQNYANWTSNSANSCAPLWVLLAAYIGAPHGTTSFTKWNARMLDCTEQAGIKLWSRRRLEQQWQFANYIVNVPNNRWLKRALARTSR